MRTTSSSCCRSRRRPRRGSPGRAATEEACRAGRGRPDRAGAGRRAAGAPRPALRLRRARGDGRGRPARRAGARCASPGRTSTGSSSSAPTTTEHTGRAAAAAPGGQRRAGADRRGRRPHGRASPRATPAPGPTCCGSPYPPGTRRTEKQPSEPAPRDRGAPRPRRPRLPTTAVRRSSTASRAETRRGRCGRCCPVTTGPTLLAEAVAATAASGRGALVCAPDHRDVARLDAALTARLGEGQPRRADRRRRARPSATPPSWPSAAGPSGSSSAPGPRPSPRSATSAWSRSGTTATTCYDEPRAPYPHAREVLLMRASTTGCARRPRGPRAQRRGGVPPAHRLGRRGRRRHGRRSASGCGRRGRGRHRPRPRGPRARSPARRCACCARGSSADRSWCRRRGSATPPGWPATAAVRRPRCVVCHGPLRISGRGRPAGLRLVCSPARRTGRCPECGGTRPARPGRSATPGPPRRSAGPCPASPCGSRPRATRVLAEVDDRPAVVVATPGAEPVAAGGYAAVLLLDTWLLLGRRRPASHRGGRAPLVQRRGPGAPRGRRRAGAGRRRPGHPGLQALVRWDPGGLARREIDERASAHLPPASRVATLTGEPADLEQALATAVPARGRGGARPGPRRRRRERSRRPGGPLRAAGAPGSGERPVPRPARAPGAAAPPASCRHLRVEVDPAELG